eukprot:c21378_g1_i1 orf=470-2173(-)
MFLLRKLSGRSHELNTTRQGCSSINSDVKDDVAKQALCQASEYVKEGNYEKALWMLEELGQLDPAVKGVAELVAVAEVCNAVVSRSCTCLSRENRNPDWYKILKVDEKSELTSIRKRYRHLALLLHPDKNKHVKAEAAFKLVSEAYACLSDKKKRTIFNVKKSLTKCRHCSPEDCVTSGSDRWSSCHVLKEQKTGLQRPGSSPDLMQTDWILDQERLRVFQARARARVFGNLAKVWRERGFTGIEEVSIGKERFSGSKSNQVVMNDKCKTRINESNKKGKENLSTLEPSPMTLNNEMGTGSKGGMKDSIEEDKVSHQQLSRPCKNLGVLIRDLQAELISSTESTGDKRYERENVVKQMPTLENVQEGDGSSSTMLGPHAEGDFAQHLSEALKTSIQNQSINAGQETLCTTENSSPLLSAHGHLCPDGFLEDPLSTLKNDACPSNDIVSKISSDKRDLFHGNTKESVCKLKKVVSDTVIEGQPKRKNKGKECIRIARKDGECAGTGLNKPSLCRRIHRDDSLDIEETILQTQKEKSEQLLKTLQQLREETKTVAASLNHFCSGRSYGL